MSHLQPISLSPFYCKLFSIKSMSKNRFNHFLVDFIAYLYIKRSEDLFWFVWIHENLVYLPTCRLSNKTLKVTCLQWNVYFQIQSTRFLTISFSWSWSLLSKSMSFLRFYLIHNKYIIDTALSREIAPTSHTKNNSFFEFLAIQPHRNLLVINLYHSPHISYI